jgi:hypothetical protein
VERCKASLAYIYRCLRRIRRRGGHQLRDPLAGMTVADAVEGHLDDARQTLDAVLDDAESRRRRV